MINRFIPIRLKMRLILDYFVLLKNFQRILNSYQFSVEYHLLYLFRLLFVILEHGNQLMFTGE